jgi:hypothetical protein
MSHASPRKKRRRWPWIVLGLLVVTGAALLLAAPALLDVERYRGSIEQALRTSTGWEPDLGAIDLSVFGGLALTVSPASLAAPDAGSRFDIAALHVRAELMPLLRGELRVHSIELRRPRIVLERPSAERGWVLPKRKPAAAPDPAATPGTVPTPGPTPADPVATPAPAERARGGLDVLIDRVAIDAGSLQLTDRASSEPLTLTLEGLSGTVHPGKAETDLRAVLEGGGEIELEGSWGRTLHARLRDVPTERLRPFLGDDLLQAGGLLSGEIDYSPPLTIEARLSGERIALLAGDQPLEQADLDFTVRRDETRAVLLEQARLESGGVELTGQGRLGPDLSLDLTVPDAPVERVLEAGRAVVPLTLQVEPPGTAGLRIALRRPAGGELKYSATGTATAAGFRAAEFLPPARDVETAFELSSGGVLDVRLLGGRVAEGPLSGALRLDSVDPVGRLSFDGELLEAVLGELLDGFAPGSGGKILGAAGLDAEVVLDLGADPFDARALAGELALDARRVVLPGWDLEHAIRKKAKDKLRGLADLASKLKIKELEGLGGSKDDPGPADEPLFDTVVADVDFDAQPWSLRSLVLERGGFSASGTGSFDPLAGVVDLAFDARFDEARTAELVRSHPALDLLVGPDRQLAVPLRIRGALTSPGIDVDLRRVAANKRREGDDAEQRAKGLLKGLLDREQDED